MGNCLETEREARRKAEGFDNRAFLLPERALIRRESLPRKVVPCAIQQKPPG